MIFHPPCIASLRAGCVVYIFHPEIRDQRYRETCGGKTVRGERHFGNFCLCFQSLPIRYTFCFYSHYAEFSPHFILCFRKSSGQASSLLSLYWCSRWFLRWSRESTSWRESFAFSDPKPVRHSLSRTNPVFHFLNKSILALIGTCSTVARSDLSFTRYLRAGATGQHIQSNTL